MASNFTRSCLPGLTGGSTTVARLLDVDLRTLLTAPAIPGAGGLTKTRPVLCQGTPGSFSRPAPSCVGGTAKDQHVLCPHDDTPPVWEPCSQTDPALVEPVDFSTATASASFDPVPIYGYLGLESVFDGPAYRPLRLNPWWDLCPNIAFCDGPESEAVPLETQYDRYLTRWRARVDENGLFWYGRTDGGWQPAPTELFPEPVLEVEQLSFCFDQNARPCFAFSKNGTVELRRFVADVPTTYSWPGGTPVLYFFGNLQPDFSLRDVFCYYVVAGEVFFRIQRELFETQHQWELDRSDVFRLVHSDRGWAEFSGAQLLSFTTLEERILTKSPAYPMFPYPGNDEAVARVTINSDLEYSQVVLVDGPYADSAMSSVSINSDLVYRPTVLIEGPYTDPALVSVSVNSDLVYLQTVLVETVSEPPLSISASIASDLVYTETVVGPVAGAEMLTVSTTINSDLAYLPA